MHGNQSTILLSFMFFLAVPLIFFTLTKKEERHHFYHEKFFIYTGIAYLVSKFVPTEKTSFPSGIVWLIGLYFAAYAFTSQRYENRLDKIEFRYSTFTTQVAAGGAFFSNQRLMGILNKKIPTKPNILDPISIFQSFAYNHFHQKFFQTYSNENDELYKTASAFRQEIINQWKNKLEGANFNKAKKLNEANFEFAQLEGANFRYAELEGADFRYAQLEGADFRYAQLKGVDFRDTQLKGTKFREAKLKGAKFEHAQLEGTNFWGAKLEGANFSHAQLEGAKFMDAQLEGANFYETMLEGANFARAQLEGASFYQTMLEGAIFRGAKLKGANFKYAELEGAKFEHAQLEGANFEYARFLAAKKLINAKNIYDIKISHPKVLEEIIKYGCDEMLTTPSDQWSKEFITHRKMLLSQWEKEAKR